MRLSVEPSTDPSDYSFTHDIRVRFAETDAMSIVHHSNYLVYFEEARVAFLGHVGRPFTAWRADGIESPVLESFVQYRHPCRFDEQLTVHLSLAAATRATFQMSYLVTAAVADTEADTDTDTDTGSHDVRTTGVTVHGCTTTAGRPTRLPTWLTELAARQP